MKKDEEVEGQHTDQNEEEDINPKKASKDVQPPQLKARLKSEADQEDSKKLDAEDYKEVVQTESLNSQTQSMGLN